jgi:hypothetical protein
VQLRNAPARGADRLESGGRVGSSSRKMDEEKVSINLKIIFKKMFDFVNFLRYFFLQDFRCLLVDF